uniref:Uncharacterized protein n=1 Tax=Anguilla anguilla TaxID=7936 RepID=A0A0E9Q6T2_ANGAN
MGWALFVADSSLNVNYKLFPRCPLRLITAMLVAPGKVDFYVGQFSLGLLLLLL